MKKIITLTLIAAWAILPQNAPAAEASVYTDFLSAYVIHGQIWNDEPVFQPGVDVAGPWGLGYSFWANMDLSDSDTSQAPNTAGKWNEINFGLNWTLDVYKRQSCAPVGSIVRINCLRKSLRPRKRGPC